MEKSLLKIEWEEFVEMLEMTLNVRTLSQHPNFGSSVLGDEDASSRSSRSKNSHHLKHCSIADVIRWP